MFGLADLSLEGVFFLVGGGGGGLGELWLANVSKIMTK